MSYSLCVHIGLPKTASTYLQEKIFSNIPGYLGKHATLKTDQDIAKQFAHIAPVSPLRLTGDPEAIRWWQRTREFAEATWPDIRQLILSEEYLTRRLAVSEFEASPIGYNRDQKDGDSKYKPQHGLSEFEFHVISKLPTNNFKLDVNRPIVGYLSFLRQSLQDLKAIKVIFVLRNQCEWLASRYVQRSWRRLGANQKDFESQVDNLIERKDDYIDWSIWVEQLQSTLGKDNVLILLYEDMGRSIFWKALSNFLGVPSLGLQKNSSSPHTQENMNVRRVAQNRWGVRPLGEGWNYKPTRLYWSETQFPLAQCMTLKIIDLLKGYINLDPAVLALLDWKRKPEIELTRDLRKRITEYVRPSNERLSMMLSRDLRPLGY